MTPREKVLAACAFDAVEYEAKQEALEIGLSQGYRRPYVSGAIFQNARLLPIITALLDANAELVSALEYYANPQNKTMRLRDYEAEAREALENHAAAMERIGK